MQRRNAATALSPVAAALRWLAHADERKTLRMATLDERRTLTTRLLASNLMRSIVISWISIPFVVALNVRDLLWFTELRHEQSAIHLLLFVMQVVFAASTIPGLILWRHRAAISANLLRAIAPSSDMQDLQRLQAGLFITSLLLIGLLNIVERGSCAPIALALVAANLVYYLPVAARYAVNGITLVSGTAVMLWPAYAHPSTTLTHLIELVALIVTCCLAGTLMNRQRISLLVSKSRLTTLNKTDALTGAANRRHVEQMLDVEVFRASASRPLSLIVIDIDHFKHVNDTHGHLAGDAVLRGITHILQMHIRADNLLGRWGGEEFLLICGDTGLDAATRLAERLRAKLAQHAFPGVGNKTASFGVAEARDKETAQSMIARADAALYEAKAKGRNRVCTAATVLTL